jgi:hypothetical protein
MQSTGRGVQMAITMADRIIALIAGLSPEDITGLPPAERRRLADWCRRAAELAEPPARPPTAGVLAQLHQGRDS